MAREHGGLGLGLAIVHDVVALHGGAVNASSDGWDRGSTFVVRLPRLSHAGRMDPARHDTSLGSSLVGVSALVVDDDADAREIAAATLLRAGADVSIVASGPEALDELERRSFDVLICDIGMPELDGYTLMQQIREREVASGQITPAVAMTAHVSAGEVGRARDSGFQAHVGKPFDMSTLVSAVRSVLAEHARALAPTFRRA